MPRLPAKLLHRAKRGEGILQALRSPSMYPRSFQQSPEPQGGRRKALPDGDNPSVPWGRVMPSRTCTHLSLCYLKMPQKRGGRGVGGRWTICSAPMRPQLEYPAQALGLRCRMRDAELLEQAQRRAARMKRGLEYPSYEDRLRKCLEKRRLCGDLEALKGHCCDIARGICFKLKR